MNAIADEVPEQRRLLTEIPGPRSRELAARRERAIPKGVSTTLQVFVVRAGPGILEDVDGNRLIDFGSGISTTNAGNSAPLVVDAIQEQAALFTHTCFMVTPYAGYVEVCERLNQLTRETTRSVPSWSTPAPRRSRTSSRWRATRPGDRGSWPSTTDSTGEPCSP